MSYEVASNMGLKQLVKESRRGKYISDLVITDVACCAPSTVATVAHQRCVITNVKFKVPETSTHQREIWNCKDANLVRMANNIEDTHWDFRASSAPSEGAQLMTDQLLTSVDENIRKQKQRIHS